MNGDNGGVPREFREQIQRMFTRILRELDAIKNDVTNLKQVASDHSGIIGKVMQETTDLKIYVEKTLEEMDMPPRQPPPIPKKTIIKKLGDEEVELEQTNTGKFSLPPMKWDELSTQFAKRIQDLEQDKLVALKAQQIVEERNEKLVNGIKISLMIGGGIVGVVSSIWAAISWGIIHIH